MFLNFYHLYVKIILNFVNDLSLLLNKNNIKNKNFFLLWHNNSFLNYNLLNYNFFSEQNLQNFFNVFFLYSNQNIKKIDLKTTMFNTNLIINENVTESFLFLRKFSFIDFFITNLIDTPSCFKKIKSIKRQNFNLPLLKLINFLMRNGKKEQYTKIFFKTLFYFYSFSNKNLNFFHLKKNNITFENNKNKFFKKFNYDWLDIYVYLTHFFNFYNYNYQFSTKLEDDLSKQNFNINFNNIIQNNIKSSDNDLKIKQNLYNKFSSILPVFSFFIYNVDKNVKKYSRGKSGKYTFIWKYITTYKRLYLAMKLIIKDIKFVNGKKLQQRIKASLTSLFLNPKKSFLWKSKTFTYNYIFKNYRKTLMTSLKTVR